MKEYFSSAVIIILVLAFIKLFITPIRNSLLYGVFVALVAFLSVLFNGLILLSFLFKIWNIIVL